MISFAVMQSCLFDTLLLQITSINPAACVETEAGYLE